MKYATLQKILEAEKEEYGTEWPKVGATLALMWLKRCVFLSKVELLTVNTHNECTPTLRSSCTFYCVSVKTGTRHILFSFFLPLLVFLIQGSPFHPDPVAEFGRRGERWDQPQPHPRQHHQGVRRDTQEVPWLDCPADLQGRLNSVSDSCLGGG